MLPSRHSTTALATMLLVLACLLALPAAASANGLPDAIDDPAPAIAPDPAANAGGDEPAPAAEPGGQDKPAAEPADAPRAGIAAHRPAPAATTTVATTSPAGDLPFTGADSRRLALLVVVASLALCAGAVSLAWARASRSPV